MTTATGATFPPLTSFGIHGVRSDDAGAASGLLNTAHQLGSSLGLAVLVTLGAAVILPAYVIDRRRASVAA